VAWTPFTVTVTGAVPVTLPVTVTGVWFVRSPEVGAVMVIEGTPVERPSFDEPVDPVVLWIRRPRIQPWVEAP
jgi:hypothetical protein